MKRLLFIATASLAGISAFAQGKVQFGNDSLHLVYYDPQVFGAPLGGTPVYIPNMPSGHNLFADLYLGTSASSLSFVSFTTFSTTAGKWSSMPVTVPDIPGGTTVYAKIQIRDSSYPTPEPTWTPDFIPPSIYWGFSVEFQFTLGSGTTYPEFGPEWPSGTFPLPPYGYGAIPVGYIPEPSTIALAGLGALAMLFHRRR
jgi:hypothetical protein